MASLDEISKDALSSLSSKFAMAGIIACIGFGGIFGGMYLAEGYGDEEAVNVNAAGIVEADEDGGIELPNNHVNQSQLPDSSFIYDVSITELANADTYLDGQTVQVIGEVVGDRITAEEDSEYCWIMLQSLHGDDEVSVYMPKSMSEAIDTYGSYGKRGTELQVRGVFNIASEEHQGASELQAEHVSVVAKGEQDVLDFRPTRMLLGTGLLAIGCMLVIVFNYLRERRR